MVKTVETVSLSSGIIGETFVAHELKIGAERLESMGLQVKFSKNALKGIEYIKNHPEDRASDLLAAYADPDVDMILCAIGGDDTYRLLPYLFENDELKKVVNDKIYSVWRKCISRCRRASDTISSFIVFNMSEFIFLHI